MNKKTYNESDFEEDETLQSNIEGEEQLAVSKSELKRQMHQLQTLGESLLDLKDNQLSELKLSDPLTDALTICKQIKKHEAKRRQLQFIGKLMRKEPEETIKRCKILIDSIHHQSSVEAASLHHCEQWRDTIINNEHDGINAFLKEYPGADRQWLRQIVRQHKQEKEKNKPPVAYRKLFQYIKEFVD